MKIRTIILSLLLFCSLSIVAQERAINYRAERVLMDSRFDGINEPVVEGILNFYKPEVDRLMQEVLGESVEEMRSGRPESLLSNFTADIMLQYAREISTEEVDFSLTNFGGLRATLPKGEVRRSDIFTIYPFENYLVVIDLLGKDVRELFESMARNRVEALSHNLQLEIKGRLLKEVLIDGEQIDPNRVYRIATIDFLLEGGDNLFALSLANKVENSGVLLREVIVESIQKLSKEGKMISASLDNRVKIEE